MHIMHRFVGRLALVTGASSGIGKGIAERLACEGMRVVACARRVERLQESAERFSKLQQEASELHPAIKHGQYIPMQCDITNLESVKKTFKTVVAEHGPDMRVIVSCAGVGHEASALTGSTEKVKEIFQTNVLGMEYVVREGFTIMHKNELNNLPGPSGCILNINSVFGHKVWRRPESHFYVASKFAARALIEGSRQEARKMKSKIRIGEISPGYVRSEMVEKSGGQKMVNAIESLYEKPMEPEDIGETVVYCLSLPDHCCVEEIILQPVDAHN